MSKKVKYEKLAQKTLRECLKCEEYSKKSIPSQISLLTAITTDDMVEFESSDELKEYLNKNCPLFKDFDSEDNIKEFCKVLKKCFAKKYKTFANEEFKPTQVFNILCVMETFFGYTELKENIQKKLNKFPKTVYVASRLYFLNLSDEQEIFELCKDLNNIF